MRVKEASIEPDVIRQSQARAGSLKSSPGCGEQKDIRTRYGTIIVLRLDPRSNERGDLVTKLF